MLSIACNRSHGMWFYGNEKIDTHKLPRVFGIGVETVPYIFCDIELYAICAVVRTVLTSAATYNRHSVVWKGMLAYVFSQRFESGNKLLKIGPNLGSQTLLEEILGTSKNWRLLVGLACMTAEGWCQAEETWTREHHHTSSSSMDLYSWTWRLVLHCLRWHHLHL